MIDVDTREAVAVIRMEHGKANALDLEMMRDLTDVLRRAHGDGARAAVLTGTGSIFGAGVDLFRVLDGGQAYTSEFVPALSRFLVELFESPLPLVAAVNGHAIAGGCIVACACDYRIMAEGKATIGIPELLVGVPFPAAAVEIMRFALPAHELQALVFTGRACAAEEAARRGLVNETVAADGLLSRARQVAQQLAAIPARVFKTTKLALRADALSRLRADRTLDDVVRQWGDAETRTHIQQYLDRVVKKQR